MGQIRWMAVIPLLSGLMLFITSVFHNDAHLETVIAAGFLNVTLAILSLDDRG